MILTNESSLEIQLSLKNAGTSILGPTDAGFVAILEPYEILVAIDAGGKGEVYRPVPT